MDEKLKALLDEAKNKGASIKQLEGIVSRYKELNPAKKKISGDVSQMDSADIYKKFFDVTPKAEPTEPVPTEEPDSLSGATDIPVGGEEIIDGVSGPTQEELQEAFPYSPEGEILNIQDSALLKPSQSSLDKKYSLKAGLERAKAMVTELPNFINRGLAAVALSKEDLARLNTLPEDQREFITNSIISSRLDPVTSVYTELSQLGAEKTNELLDLADEYRAKVTQYEGNIVDDINAARKGDMKRGGQAFDRVVNSALESLPAMAMAFIPYVGLPLVGAGTGALKQEEQEREGKPLDLKTYGNSLINGFAEYWFERYTVGLMGPINNVFRGARPAAVTSVKKLVGDVFKGMGVEGWSEGMTTLVQEGADSLYTGEFNLNNFLKDILDSIIVGGFVGAGMKGSQGLYNYTVYRSMTKDEQAMHDETLSSIDQLEETRTKENSKDVDGQIRGLETDLKDFKQNKIIEFEGLEYNDKKRVVKITQEVDGISKVINDGGENMDIHTKGKLIDNIVDLESEKTGLLESGGEKIAKDKLDKDLKESRVGEYFERNRRITEEVRDEAIEEGNKEKVEYWDKELKKTDNQLINEQLNRDEESVKIWGEKVKEDPSEENKKNLFWAESDRDITKGVLDKYNKVLEAQKKPKKETKPDIETFLEEKYGKDYTDEQITPEEFEILEKSRLETKEDIIKTKTHDHITERDANWDAQTKEALPESKFENKEALEKEIKEGTWGMLTAENPNSKQVSDKKNIENNKKAEVWLKEKGYETDEIFGKYDNSERSFLVPNLTREDAIEFAKEFGQVSIATNEGLVYQDGKIEPTESIETGGIYDNYYSTIKTKDGNVDIKIKYADGVERTGQQNEKFFTEKAAKESSKIPYKPVIKVNTKTPVAKAYDKFSAGGNFTGHISKMIAGFQEKQKQVAEAIVKGGFKRFLDIGTSEGGMVKTVASQNKSVTAVGIDPNSQMKANFESTPEVKNAEFKQEAYQGSWTGADGTKINEFKPKEKIDVVNEDFTFQFVNNNREKQVAGVKKMMTPDGIFITSEKFIGTKNYEANEKKKHDHQSKYFNESELTKDKEEIVVGMETDMVNDVDYMNTLKKHFEYVEEFWNAGNFKGFLASDNIDVLNKFKQDVGNLETEFTDKGSETKVQPKISKDAKKVPKQKGPTSKPVKDKTKKAPKRAEDKKQVREEPKKTDKGDKTTTEKPAVSKLDKKIKELGQAEKKMKIALSSQAKKAVKAIEKLLPGTRIVLKPTQETYEQAVGKENGDTLGMYVPKDGNIYINLESADESTVGHEVFHAILLNTLRNKSSIDKAAQKITTEMISALERILPKDSNAYKAIQFTREQAKAGYEENVVNEEILAQITGYLSTNYMSMPTSAKTRVKVWVNKMAKLFGIDILFSQTAKDQDVVNFLDTLSEKIKRGQEITKKDVEIIAKDKAKTIKDDTVEPRKQKMTNTPVSVQKKALEAFKAELEKSESNKKALRAAVGAVEGYHVTKQQMVDFIKEIAPELFKKYDMHYIMQKEFSKQEKDAWDGAITMAQGVINDGGSIGKAINVGVETMRDSSWWKEQQQQEEKDYSLQQFKEKIRKAFETELNSEDKDLQDRMNKVGEKMKKMSTFDRFRIKVQDRMYPLKKVIRLLDKEGVKIPDKLNPYILETLQGGRAKQAIEDMMNNIVDQSNPNSLFSRMKKAGITQKQLGDFMLAEHAIERNEAKLKELKEMLDILEGKDPDVDVKAYKKSLQKSLGITKVEKEIQYRINGLEKGTYAGYGMSTNEAIKTVNKVEDSGKEDLYNGFSEEFREDVINESLRAKYETGLISEETFNILSDTYQKYVPLMVEEIGEVGGDTRGIGNAMTGLHRIKGDVRERVRKNPMLAGIEQFTSSIMNSELNRTGLGLLDLVEQMKGNNFMEIINEEDYAIKSDKKKEHVIKVIRDGKDYYINIYDKDLAISLKKSISSNPDAIRFLNTYNTWMRNVLTQLNPAFMIPNYIRDLQMAFFNLPKEVRDKVSVFEFTKMSLQSFVDMRDYRGKRKTGKGPTTRGGKAYEELLQLGGISKWGVFTNPQDVADEIARMIKSEEDPTMREIFKDAVKNIDKQTLNRVRRVGDYMEHANRLAIYKASIKSGLSKERSAFEAKEGTINFDRSSEYGKILNTLFLFSNASIQGSTRMLHSIKTNPVGATKLLGKIVAGSATMMGLIYMMGGGDEYEEESEWSKRHNIYLPFFITTNGKKRLFKIPAPYGLGFAPYLGQKSVEMMLTDKPTDGLEIFKALAGSSEDILNPLGGGIPVPTLSKIPIELMVNYNFMGNEIYLEDLGGKKIVKSEHGFRNTGEGYKEFAKIMNKMSSGNKNESGLIDMAPEEYKHILEGLGGGVWIFSKNMKEFLLRDEDYKIPVVRRFLSTPSDKVYTVKLRDYYKRSGNKIFTNKELDDINKTFLKAIKEGYMTPDGLKNILSDIIATQLVKKVAQEHNQTSEEFTGEKAEKDAIYEAMKEFRNKQKKKK